MAMLENLTYRRRPRGRLSLPILALVALLLIAQVLSPADLQLRAVAASAFNPYQSSIYHHGSHSIGVPSANSVLSGGWARGLDFADIIEPSVRQAGSPTVSMAGRTLLFSDDFDGTALDQGRWNPHYWWRDDNGGCTIAPNEELEWYQPDDVLVNNGILRIRAQRRAVTNLGGQTYQYTSGVITTGRERWDEPAPDRFAFQYGYAEIRAKVPKGKGLWPAFWLMAADQVWPPEIDVLEILGDQTSAVHMSTHYLNDDGTYGASGGSYIGPDFSVGWHTFAMDWQPNAIIWYVDGVERWRSTNAKYMPTEPMYLTLNLAVGGSWPGSPDSSTPFPSYFEVDYVRAWSPQSDPPGVPQPRVYLPLVSK